MGNNESIHMPKMAGIREAAEITGLTEFALRRLVKEGKLVHVKSGNRVFINLEKLAEYLSNGESSGGGEDNG